MKATREKLEARLKNRKSETATKSVANSTEQPLLSPTSQTAVTKFLSPIEITAVSAAIGGFLSSLLVGLEQGGLVASVAQQEGTLIVRLHSNVIGTVATRSRLPIEWILLKTLEFSLGETNQQGTLLKIQGIQLVPIQGGRDAWNALRPRFAKAKDVDAWRSIAWKWWDDDGGRDSFVGTKMWRVVESLAGLGFGKAVPPYAKGSMVLGCTLGIRQNVPTFYYRYDAKNDAVDVVGTLECLPSTSDPSSAEFDRDKEHKDAMGRALFSELAASPSKRQVAAKFATSSLNYGALFCAEGEGVLGASPEAVNKMVTAAKSFGGATKLDHARGKASPWQFDDETYQMTGDDGRVVWRPLTDQMLREMHLPRDINFKESKTM